MVSALYWDQAVWVQALVRDIVLCSRARHFTLTVSLSTQLYKWVPANLVLGVTLNYDRHPIQGRVEIPLDGSCYRNWDKHYPFKEGEIKCE